MFLEGFVLLQRDTAVLFLKVLNQVYAKSTKVTFETLKLRVLWFQGFRIYGVKVQV